MIEQWTKFIAKYYCSEKLNIDRENIEEYIRVGIGLVLLDPIRCIGQHIGSNPPEIGIIDDTELPFHKDTIFRIFIITLLLEKDINQINAMKKYLTEVIPRFQEGVGKEALYPGGSKVSLRKIFALFDGHNLLGKKDENKLREELNKLYVDHDETTRVDEKTNGKHDNLQGKVLQDLYKVFDIFEFIEKYHVAS
jgi:hypothetical protein